MNESNELHNVRGKALPLIGKRRDRLTYWIPHLATLHFTSGFKRHDNGYRSSSRAVECCVFSSGLIWSITDSDN